MTPQETLEELTKSKLQPDYYANKYCEVFDLTRGGTFKFTIFPRQIELLRHYRENRFSLVLKPRQAGVSTVTAFHAAHLMMFAPKSKKQKILIIANMQDTAHEFLSKIVSFIDTAPSWLLDHDDEGAVIYTKKNAGYIELPNGSSAKAKATSKNALRGYTPTLLILDEAAFIEQGAELWTSSLPVLSTGGNAILLSTPNGYDPLYYKQYDGAQRKKNPFKIFEMNWYQDPRFNKDLEWIRTTVIEGEPEPTREVLECWDLTKFKGLIADGYKPTSSWFRGMCEGFNNDSRQIAQELECDFLGSGDNVVDEEYIKNQERGTLNPVQELGYDKSIWVWEEPIPNHQYIIGSDVGRGDSEDFSTFSIWDMDTGRQVVEYQGHIPPDSLGVLVDEWGRKYEALCIVDITGGMGQSTVIKLMDLKYPHMHYTEGAGAPAIKKEFQKFKKANNTIPGFTIGVNRTNIISTLEIAIRTGQIQIRSTRLIGELRTFVYKNGRPDHMTGYHDDLIFAVAMVLYVFQHAFKSLKRYKAVNEAMLNAYGVDKTTRASIHNSNVDANTATEFAWLFGK